jgi:uncharacterized membrane protein
MVNNKERPMLLEDRVAALEARTHALEELLESGARTVRPAPRVASVAPPAPATPSPAFTRPARAPGRDLEDLFGGSGLAWLGGIAVVAGLAFLLTIAVSRGWLGEEARTALAGAISLGLLGAGVWLRERRGRNAAAIAAAAAGVAGAFGALVAAGSHYDLIDDRLALTGALLVGGAATALAVRWRAPLMGWIGLCGALLAPAVVSDADPLVYLAIAYAATVAVLVWQRWTALGFAAFGLTAVQWMAPLVFDDTPAHVVPIVAVFGALTVVAAVGFELRRREPHVRVSAVALLVLNALVVDFAGYAGFGHTSLAAAKLLLVAVAAVHLGVGLAGTRLGGRGRIPRELSLVALGLGIVLADIALAAYTNGLPLVLSWVAGTIGFGVLARRPRASADRVFALAGLGGHLLSALAHALIVDAPVSGGPPSAAGILAVAAVAAGAAISARLADRRRRVGLDVLALALLVYLSVLALDGVALTAALAGQAAGLAALARRDRDPVAVYAAAAFAGLALLDALTVLAPPTALLDGLAHPLPAAGALAAAAGALALAARALPRDGRAALGGAAAGTVLYLASVELVSAVQPALTAQTLLSVLWGVVGVALVVAGLVRDDRVLRRAGLGLLALTAGKVFLYDLSALDSLARVGSLMGLGVLLLAGGFAWQRVRPLPLPDLRDAAAR